MVTCGVSRYLVGIPSCRDVEVGPLADETNDTPTNTHGLGDSRGWRCVRWLMNRHVYFGPELLSAGALWISTIPRYAIIHITLRIVDL
jgi:hypothetical protein